MRHLFFSLILVMPVSGSAVAVSAEPGDTLFVSGEVSPAVVKVGERVTVQFRIALPEGGEALMGPPAPVELGPVDILVSRPLVTHPDSAGWILEAAFFQYGDVDLAQVPFRLQTPRGEIPVRLLPYTISVVATLPDTLTQEADIRPITGPLEVPRHWDWVRIGVAGILLAVLGGALIWWRRKPRGVDVVAPYVPALPPEVLALRALKELERDSLPARGQFKEHYARLSLILRHYLEGRCKIPAVESTSDEIRESLEHGRQFPDTARDSLLELLYEADLVKFAKGKPDVTTATQTLVQSKDWVNRATPSTPQEGTA